MVQLFEPHTRLLASAFTNRSDPWNAPIQCVAQALQSCVQDRSLAEALKDMDGGRRVMEVAWKWKYPEDTPDQIKGKFGPAAGVGRI
ncbi:MAG: hypothetical protein Q9212_002656 [Teloschistes hypoglaucus]